MKQKVPGLDGLRAFAVALVVLFHQYLLPVGWVGVQIFFVLSGYLISRPLDEDRDAPLGPYLRSFYGRRALRIFPLYYAVIAVLCALSFTRLALPGLREGVPYAATYTYNFWYATRASGFSEFITHFWTLCVEEQVYLVWPLVFYFCPRRYLRGLLGALIVLGPLVRYLLARPLAAPGATHLWDFYVALDVLTPTHLDAFAIGAYAALFPWGGQRRLLLVVVSALLMVGALLIHRGHLPVASFGYPIGLRQGYAFVWGYSLINLAAALLIDCLASRKVLPVVFESRVLSYLGKISYGLYVFHYPIQAALSAASPHASVLVRVGAQTVLTISLASGSYYLWEKPFLSLKDRWFPPPSADASSPEAKTADRPA
jgi:peptidoglycan/LPS O-acetylase OafA/YrhL